MDFRHLRMVFFATIVSRLGKSAHGQAQDRDEDFGTGDTACHLTSQSFYSYVVRIWNTDWKNTTSHGSMLTFKSILTNCAPYVALTANGDTYVPEFDKLEVYGQKMRSKENADWSFDGDNVCYQKRKVTHIFRHPQCELKGNMDLYFNFAVLELDQPFLVFRKHSYPAISLPNTPDFAIYNIILVNILQKSGCEIPLFYYHARQKPVFAKNLAVNSMKWVTECIPRLCEMEPFKFTPSQFRYPGQWPGLYPGNKDWQKGERDKHIQECKVASQKTMNYTNLCVYFPHSSSIKIGHDYMDIRSHLWTGGAPLVCNGTAIGITASAQDRSKMATFRQDFYLINTFIRVWPWLLELRDFHGADWLDQHLLEKEMRARGAQARDGGGAPEVDPNLVRSWSEDARNRSSRNRQSIASLTIIHATIVVVVFSHLRLSTYFGLY